MEWHREVELRVNRHAASLVEKAELPVQFKSCQSFTEIIRPVVKYEGSNDCFSFRIDIRPTSIIRHSRNSFGEEIVSHEESRFNDDLTRSVLITPLAILFEGDQLRLGPGWMNCQSEEPQ